VSLLIDQLASYLQAQGEGAVGTSIFKLHRSSAPLVCLSLHATGGYPPDRYTERERPTVMLFARAATPDEALRKAYSLFGKLHGRQNLDLGSGMWALTIEATSSPAYVGTEETGEGTAHLASLNLAFDLRRPSS
jgi:hypothetical protein